MANEDVVGATAANRDVDSDPKGPHQDCEDVVHISLFFDGTGNNRREDGSSQRWSNVSRLYDAALADDSRATYRIYISGVGTQYNGDADGWLEKAGVWAEDKLGGLGFGAGGDRRMEFGDLRVNDRLRDVLISNALKLGGEVAKYARENEDKSFSEVNRMLGKHRLIKMINLSVFGFSRGAALARAFTNRVVDFCKEENGRLTYDGYPIRFTFLGLFDTVASFGLPAQNVRTPFSRRELRISPKVERCVHFVAAHELRFSFPVDLIRLNGQLAGDWLERTYPGVHSDVGGGYEPVSQRIDNNYSRIPMRDMLREAINVGARLNSYDTLRAVNEPMFLSMFECRPETEQAFRAYMAVCGASLGSIEEQVKRHMELLYSAYGTMYRRGMELAGDYSRSQNPLKYLGPKGMAWEVQKYRGAASAGRWFRIGSGLTNAYAQYVKPADWQLAAWDDTAPAGVIEFVGAYVHDSKVDFLMNVEPFSYFRPRGIDESTSSIWQDAGAWVSEKSTELGATVRSGVAAGKAQVEHAGEAIVSKVNEAGRALSDTASETAQAIRRRALRAKQYAEQKIAGGIRMAQETATDIAAQVKHAARRASESASSAYESAARHAQAAARAAADRMRAAKKSAESVVESGTTWLRDTVDGWLGTSKPNK